MFAAYIIYDNQITDIIKYNNVFKKLNQSSIDKYIIGYNIQFSDNQQNFLDINIIDLSNKDNIKDNLLSFYAYKLFKKYTYCIELDFNFYHNIDLNNINKNQYNIWSGYNTILSLNEIFTNLELEVIKKLNKNIKLSLFNNKIVNNFKICNVSSLHINTFYENIIYIYNKLLSNNINVSTMQLYTIYQLLYPNYITFNLLETIYELSKSDETCLYPPTCIEILDESPEQLSEELLEELPEELIYQNNIDIIIKNQEIDWFVIRSHFKKINNNKIISLQNTYLKKDRIKENKLDPDDKINLPINRKLELKSIQPFEYFYCVFYK